MAYYWLYNRSNDNIYILILIIVILALIIVNFKMWTKKTDRFDDTGTVDTSNQTTTTSNQTTTTPNSNQTTTTISNTPTTTQPPTWINLATGLPVTVTQEIYDKSIVEGLSNYYNKTNSGTIMINGNTYKYVSPAPFKYGSYNYYIIKDVDSFNAKLATNPNDSNYIYIYVTAISIINYPSTTLPQPSITLPQPSITLPQQNTTSTQPSTTTKQSITIPTLPLCYQPTLPLCYPQTTYDNKLMNPNFYISSEEQARRNAWSQLDGDEGSLANTNGTPTYKNDITYSSSLLNNTSVQSFNYSTIGDYATLDSLGSKLTDTLGGIKTDLGYTILDEQLGTFNSYNPKHNVASSVSPISQTPNTYDNTADYNTGMNPYTVNGVTPNSGTVSGTGSGISSKITQDNRPFFMQKDFDGVSNIFAPNIIISNPPLTEDGNPDISFQM
jgi:nitrogen fixation-related uncharacterized protein